MRGAVREHTPDRTFVRARDLRGRMTNAEEIVWRALRGRKFLGLKFRRQMPLGSYIVDFACVERRLVVECDGRTHDNDDRRAHDMRRDAWLRENGWRVLRLTDERVIGGGNLVLNDIRDALRLPSSDSG